MIDLKFIELIRILTSIERFYSGRLLIFEAFFFAVGADVFEASGLCAAWKDVISFNHLRNAMQCSAISLTVSFYKIYWFVPIESEGLNFSLDKFSYPFRFFFPRRKHHEKIAKEKCNNMSRGSLACVSCRLIF